MESPHSPGAHPAAAPEAPPSPPMTNRAAPRHHCGGHQATVGPASHAKANPRTACVSLHTPRAGRRAALLANDQHRSSGYRAQAATRQCSRLSANTPTRQLDDDHMHRCCPGTLTAIGDRSAPVSAPTIYPSAVPMAPASAEAWQVPGCSARTRFPSVPAADRPFPRWRHPP